MIIVLFFGALGWVMEKLDWPRPPVLLGLVLGPLAENRLFLSTDNYGLAWTASPRRHRQSFALTLIGIFYPIYKKPQGSETESRSEARAKRLDEATQPRRTSSSAPRTYFHWRGDRDTRAGALAEPQLRLPRRPVSLGHRYTDFVLCFFQLARDLHGTNKKKELIPAKMRRLKSLRK